MCVEEVDTVKKGENILKYTNGTYLVAPYDSVITEMSNTASNGKFTVTVEFDNDGDVMLGMTAGINI